MKTLQLHVLKSAVLALFLMAGASVATAQTDRMASMDQSSKVIAIDETLPFGYMYQLDISDCKFADKGSAEEFFGDISTDLVSYVVHYDKQTVDIVLNVRKQPHWEAAEWNKYLKSLEKK